LRHEIAEVRASRERLVLAADAGRRGIERELHEGVQQDLVALAVNLQLAGQLVDTDPAAAKTLLEEMGRDIRQALVETAQLAQRVYPPLLEAGLAVALRSALATAAISIPVAVDVAPSARYPHTVARTIYLCCLEILEHAETGARATVTVRDEPAGVVFDLVVNGTRPADPELNASRDRVEALGGRLTIASEPGGGARVTGSLPLPR